MKRWCLLLWVLLSGSAACGSSAPAAAGGGGTAGTGGSAGEGGSAGASGSDCEGLPAPSGDFRFDGLVTQLVDSAHADGIPGGAVVVYKDGKLHEAVFGSKSSLECEPVDSSTRFNGARLAGIVTTLTALRMARNGKVDLDAPLQQNYVPDLALDAASEKWAPELTLRGLLSFSSGYWPTYWRAAPGACPPTLPVVGGQSGAGTLRQLFSGHPASIFYKPGTEWMFGNAAFSLAGLALEEADHMPFAQVVKTELAAPSALDLTFDPDVAKTGDLAEPPSQVSTCGALLPVWGLYLSVQDLGKLVKSIASGGDSVLSKSEVGELLGGGVVETVPGVGASSLAFPREPLPGLGSLAERWGAVASSPSSATFASGVTLIIPEQHFGFAVLENGKADNEGIDTEVFKTYFPNVKPYDHSLAPATWGDYAGKYQRDDGALATVQLGSGKITLDINGSTPVPLQPSGIQAFAQIAPLMGSLDPDMFEVPIAGQSSLVRFYRDAAGKPSVIGDVTGIGDASRPFYRVP